MRIPLKDLRTTFDFELDFRFDVWTICSHTPLGCVNTVAGQSITLEVLRKKPAMLEACQPRQPDEAPELDKSDVPGDHLGAAGFDSAFFCHLKRNWTYNTSTVRSNRLELQIKKTGTDGGILTIPDTMAEFRAAYTLSFAQATLRQRRPLQEVKNVVDIHCSVVYLPLVSVT